MLSQKLWFATPPCKAAWRRSCATILSTAIASMTLASCATSTKPSPAGPDPLVIAACPELSPLNDASFGATTLKLVQVAGQYNVCRAAALAGQKAAPVP